MKQKHNLFSKTIALAMAILIASTTLTGCSWFSSRQDESSQEVVLEAPEPDAQDPGELKGQGQGGIIFVVFDGVDGLTGDAAGSGQLLLGQPQGLSFFVDDIFHLSHRIFSGSTAGRQNRAWPPPRG